jgi:hypothetical protein
VNLRITTAGIAAALSLALVPAAQAEDVVSADHVCNTASQNWQGADGFKSQSGWLKVSKDDPQGFVHYYEQLIPKKDVSGLVVAAEVSHALASCGDDWTASGTLGGNT